MKLPATERPRLGIIATHPIQYQAPWFRALAESGLVDLKVYFCLLPNPTQQGIGFGIAFQWDVPLLEGYNWECLPSSKSRPGLGSFLDNRIRGMTRHFRQDNLDLMIINGWNTYPMFQALGACIRLGIPRIVRGESNALRRRGFGARLFHRCLLPLYDAYLAIGKSSADFYRRYGISADRIFMARYFVDSERFARQAREEMGRRLLLRKQWNIPANSVCFVYAGKLEPKKRLLDLLEALAACQKMGTTAIHLLVLGSGELENLIRLHVTKEQLPVSFAGFLNQAEIARGYVAGDAIVLPSDHGETWGLVVNEAMACGLPAIVSDAVGCGPDLIVEGRTGFTFPLGDIDALANRMLTVAELIASGHDFVPELAAKMRSYSVAQAVDGTLLAVDYLRDRIRTKPSLNRHE